MFFASQRTFTSGIPEILHPLDIVEKDWIAMDTFRDIDNISELFLTWKLSDTPTHFDKEPYCSIDDVYVHKEIKKWHKNVNADDPAPLGGVSAAVAGCVLVLTVGLLLLFAVFRRRVEYRVYRVKQTLRQQVRRWKRVREDETLVLEDKKFDVYLSYGEEDYPWVRTRLLPLLENEDREEVLNKEDREELLNKEDREELLNKEDREEFLNKEDTEELLNKEEREEVLNKDREIDNHPTGMDKYRVYCGDRDAHPSKTELGNICENIEQSRIALVVLSNNYTQKPLHTWELEHILFCKDEAIIEGLVLIMMEELTYKQIPPALHRQVQQDNVLRWEMYRTKERKFHKDLLRSLR